jgi:hypothetical protein
MRSMTRERDLFRAIVISAIAMVSGPACDGDDPVTGDAGERVDSGDAREDAGPPRDAATPLDGARLDGALADAGGARDAASPMSDAEPEEVDSGDDAMVLIL